VTDRLEGDLITFADHQGGQIAVDVIEIGQPQEGLAPKGL
jgi:hypothetical protein